MTMLRQWSRALVEPDLPLPAGLVSWNGSDPAHRFNVYRNNVIVSLVDALATTFPVIQWLVGEEFFRAMAREFVRTNPPRSPVLGRYGSGFPEFVSRFGPAGELPYLPDVARLELAYLDAYAAADVPPVAESVFLALLEQHERLPHCAFDLHPSFTSLSSAYACVSLWGSCHGDPDITTVDPCVAESAWVLRCDQSMKVLRMSSGDCCFVAALQQNLPLGHAMEAALSVDKEFDPGRCLAVLLREKMVVAIADPKTL